MNAKEFGAFRISGKFPKIKMERIKVESYPFPEAKKIASAVEKNDFEKIAKLHFEVGKSFARSFKKFVGKIPYPDLAGFHGQTVYHREGKNGTVSVQIGEPGFLAQICPVVYGFRNSDISAGGVGAPLSPLIHFVLFRSPKRKRIVINLGGIANATVIPENAQFSEVKGFDIGPANALADHYCREVLKIPFDRDGKIAERGKPDVRIVKRLCSAFLRGSKRSLGVEVEESKKKFIELARELSPEDALATAYLISAQCIKAKLEDFREYEVILCGGGAKNPFFVQLLEDTLPHTKVRTSNDLGILPEEVEPALFALLAYLNAKGTKISMKHITGARYPYTPGRLCKA